MDSPSKADVHTDSGIESEEQETNVEEDQEPNSGFAVAIWCAILGGACWLAPHYVGFPEWLQWVGYAVGGLSIDIGVCGAFLELGEATESKAFGSLGVGSFFLVLGVLLHMAAGTFPLAPALVGAAKMTAIAMGLLSAGMLLMGIAEATNEVKSQSQVPYTAK